MKLQLPTVSLICVDCVDVNRAIKILEHCKSKVDFGAVRLLTSIPTDYEHAVKITPLNSLIAYSIFILTKVHEYIKTDHVLIVQRDGWILNPESFNPSWLEFDYIGPLFVQYDKVGSGGFSLRSKKLMVAISKTLPSWENAQQDINRYQDKLGYYEDGVISFSGVLSKFKFPSLEQAADFAHGGNRNPKYFREKPFGFHRTFAEINFKTGVIDYSDLTKDLHVTYDHEIDTL